MNTVLRKIFDKWFRYKIKSEWSEKIQAYHFTEEQEKELASDVAGAVNDGINDIIDKIAQELDTAYWLVDTTIEDTITRIEEYIEILDQLEAETAEEEEMWTSNSASEEGDLVMCSYEDRASCKSCLHNEIHEYDPSSCDFDCSVPPEAVCCEKVDRTLMEVSDTDSEMQDIIDTGGV